MIAPENQSKTMKIMMLTRMQMILNATSKAVWMQEIIFA